MLELQATVWQCILMFTETIYGPTVTNNVFTNNEFTMVPITTKDTLLQIHFDSYSPFWYFWVKGIRIDSKWGPKKYDTLT